MTNNTTYLSNNHNFYYIFTQFFAFEVCIFFVIFGYRVKNIVFLRIHIKISNEKNYFHKVTKNDKEFEIYMTKLQDSRIFA